MEPAPGLERPLKKEADFVRFAGQKVQHLGRHSRLMQQAHGFGLLPALFLRLLECLQVQRVEVHRGEHEGREGAADHADGEDQGPGLTSFQYPHP